MQFGVRFLPGIWKCDLCLLGSSEEFRLGGDWLPYIFKSKLFDNAL
jgi:hypothetical protein